MWRRILGRAVTSPAAFFIAGVLDAAAFWLGWARARARARVPSGDRRGA